MNNAVLANLLDSAAEVFEKGKRKKYHFDFWQMAFVRKAGPGRVSFYSCSESIVWLLYYSSERLAEAEQKKKKEWIAAIEGGHVEGKAELAPGFDVVARLREASTLLEVAFYEV